MNMQRQDDAPATKADIKALLSSFKEELKADFATKDDLLATQRALERKIALEIVKTHGRIDQLRDDLRGEMKLLASGVYKKIDGFMSKIGKIDRAQVIADWRVSQLEKRTDRIESRPS